jgi:hypothetical protein
MAWFLFVVSALENVVSEMTMNQTARAAKARDKAYKLTDSHRLYLLVPPNGSKLWKWGYAYAVAEDDGLGLIRWSVCSMPRHAGWAQAQLAEGKDPSVIRKLGSRANLEAGRNAFSAWRVMHDNARANGRRSMPPICP